MFDTRVVASKNLVSAKLFKRLSFSKAYPVGLQPTIWPVTLQYLSRNLAFKITSDFHAKRQPQNQSNLLQIRRISLAALH